MCTLFQIAMSSAQADTHNSEEERRELWECRRCGTLYVTEEGLALHTCVRHLERMARSMRALERELRRMRRRVYAVTREVTQLLQTGQLQ